MLFIQWNETIVSLFTFELLLQIHDSEIGESILVAITYRAALYILFTSEMKGLEKS